MGKYGYEIRQDVMPVIERQATLPVRETHPTRVTDVLSSVAAVFANAYNSNATTVGPPKNGSGPLQQAWNAEVADTDTIHDNATNNSRLTIPTGKPGTYRFTCRIQWASAGENGVTGYVKLRKNGATDQKTVSATLNNGSTTVIMLDYTDNYIAGDYLEIRLDATGGSAGTVTINHGNEVSYFITTKQAT